MFKAVVFDMDGVITDTEKLYRRFQMEEGLARGVPEEVMLLVGGKLAGGNRYTNKSVFESIVGRDIDYFDYREKMIARLENYIAKNGVELKHGVVETLRYLKSKDVRIGLATSTSEHRARNYLRQHDIEKYFDVTVFGDMIKNGKPAPDIYLKACELLKVRPEEALAVEDSVNGIKSAGTAGLYPVMVIDLIQPTDDIRDYVKQVYKDITELRKII